MSNETKSPILNGDEQLSKNTVSPVPPTTEQLLADAIINLKAKFAAFTSAEVMSDESATAHIEYLSAAALVKTLQQRIASEKAVEEEKLADAEVVKLLETYKSFKVTKENEEELKQIKEELVNLLLSGRRVKAVPTTTAAKVTAKSGEETNADIQQRLIAAKLAEGVTSRKVIADYLKSLKKFSDGDIGRQLGNVVKVYAAQGKPSPFI